MSNPTIKEKAEYIKAYFDFYPQYSYDSLKLRVLGNPERYDGEVENLYNFLKMELANEESGNYSSVLESVLGKGASIEKIIGFLSAIQWTGTGVGKEVVEK